MYKKTKDQKPRQEEITDNKVASKISRAEYKSLRRAGKTGASSEGSKNFAVSARKATSGGADLEIIDASTKTISRGRTFKKDESDKNIVEPTTFLSSEKSLNDHGTPSSTAHHHQHNRNVKSTANSRAVAFHLADIEATEEDAKIASLRPDRLVTSHQLFSPVPGAHRVGGVIDDDDDDDYNTVAGEEEAPSLQTSQSSFLSPIAASVVQPKVDVELQTQNIEQRVRDEVRRNLVTAKVIRLSTGGGTRAKMSRRCLGAVLALLTVSVIVGIVVVLTAGSSKGNEDSKDQLTNPPIPTAPPSVFTPECTLCYDGSEPKYLNAAVQIRGFTCADLQINLAELDSASDQNCKSGQAAAWLYCSCPTLPPRPLQAAVCSAACAVDSRPDAFDSQLCRNFEAFVEIAGQQQEQCAMLVDLVPDQCACIPRIPELRDILKSISDEQKLLDMSTPQYRALEWLANKDPANLTSSSESSSVNNVLKDRYFGALIWFNFGGEDWEDQFNFMSERALCDWNDSEFGIFCNDEGTSLTKMKMNNNTLVGRFPEEFTKFTDLVSIDLSNNFITGTIPSTIGDLSILQNMQLAGNVAFGGHLPPALFELQKLSMLWLDSCSLVGSLPENIGNAVSLTSLSIRNAELTGTIPASISQLTLLEVLQLSQNELVGTLPNLDSMSSILQLELFVNNLEGTIPIHYGQFSEIESLSIDSNLLSGTVPDFSGNTRLSSLRLDDNGLRGSIEKILATTPATFMEQLGLDINNFTGSIPTSIGTFQQLKSLWLFHNWLTGTIPTEIGLLSNSLRVLEADDNMLEGTIPTQLDRLSNLAFLYIGQNQLMGPIPSVLGQMTALIVFSSISSSLNGTLPSELGLMTSLVELDLYDNELTGTIPSSLGSMMALERLEIPRNQLVSSIPSELKFLTNLWVLDLHENYLNGTIPSELAALRSVEIFSFALNDLTGTVPTEMASIPNLDTLGVFRNEITGDLGPYFCERSNAIANFEADCYGDGPKVLCDCCSKCCTDYPPACYLL